MIFHSSSISVLLVALVCYDKIVLKIFWKHQKKFCLILFHQRTVEQFDSKDRIISGVRIKKTNQCQVLNIFVMKEKRKLNLFHLLSTPPTLCIFWRVRKGVGCAEEGVGREDERGCVTDIYLLEFCFAKYKLNFVSFRFFFSVYHLKVSKFSFSSKIQ